MNLSLKLILLSLLFLLPFKNGFAETDYIFEHLSTDNGLSHGSVSGMLKDSKGFMWFATWDGINRYDGHSFKVFKPSSHKNFISTSNRVETIKQDSLGNIWIITFDAKAFRLNRFTEEFDCVLESNDDFLVANISDIIPCSNGDVWLLSNNLGLFRVVTNAINNNIKVSHFHEKSEISIPGNTIVSFVIDKNNNTWINTNKGIACLKYNSILNEFSEVKFQQNIERIIGQYQITVIHDADSSLYLGTNKGMLLEYNSTNKSINEINFGNSRPITQMSQNIMGELLIGTSGNGVFNFNTKTYCVTKQYSDPIIKNVLKTFIDSNGRLWVESTEAGISKINSETGDFKHYRQQLAVSPDIRSNAQCGLKEDENKTIWLTLKGGGFGYYKPETDNIEYFYNQPGSVQSKISNFVNCFYKDPSGILWMSTYFKGIEKVTFVQKKFKFIQPATQYNLSIANEIRAIFEDSKGVLWVATKNQELFLLDKDFQLIKKIDELNGQKIGRVYSIQEDSEQNIYLGTKGNGLFKLSYNELLDFDVTHYLHNKNINTTISDNNIYSILIDHENRIWIGTYGGGLNLLIEDTFRHYKNGFSTYPAEKGLKVRHITEDSKGNIWAGTTDGILFFNNQKLKNKAPNFSFYSSENGKVKGLLSNDILWILSDLNENIWLSSLGGGLAKLTTKNDTLEFTSLTKADGLSSDVIFTITSDIAGNLWMSTENGISFYNPFKQIFKNYSRYDGIVNSTFSEAAIAKRLDGSIVFGSNNGLYSFLPLAFNNEKKKIDIEFTTFQLFGKEITPGNASVLKKSIIETNFISLKYNQNIFGISWAGLDFKMQEKFLFDYQLEGFENDWHYSYDHNQVNYTKLPPGNYIFKVRFNDPELQILNKPKEIHIKILPPLWKTKWAYVLYLIFTICIIEISRRIITSMIKLRNKVIIEKELTNIKLNFFTNISHELRTPLTLILGPAKELLNSEKLSDKGKAHISLIEQNAQRLLRQVNHLLDFRKIQSNKMELVLKEIELVPFVHSVCHNFDKLALEKNIRFSIQNPNDQIVILMDEEKMDSILFNLLSNAFKFTPENGKVEVQINVSLNDQKVSIDIIDSGIGIPSNKVDSLFKIFNSNLNKTNENYTGSGIGLALSKELVQLHNGTLSYRPAAGGGATFSIQLNCNIKKAQGPYDTENKLLFIVPENTVVKSKHKELILSGKKPQILVVEDNHELRNFIRLQLEDDYRVLEANNGKNGLTKALEFQPDIILSDIMMPEMDGIEMLDRIKNNFDTSHIPLVLLSAKSSVESKIEGLKYGADAYLTKPFNSKQLKAQLENLLNQRVLLRKSFINKTNEPTNIQDFSITEKDALLLKKVQEIIEDNLANSNFKIQNIYQEVGMGRSKFSDKMKGLTGLSPIEFIKEYRLEKAKNLLQTGNYNVTEVSYMSGFSDAGYFSKCYKERFGVNPSQNVRKQ